METPKTSSDEINLEELLLKVVLTIKRNLGLIIAFFVIGTAMGFIHSIMGTKIYESKMMVTSDILTDSYANKLNKNLNDIILDGNMDLLASRLNLSTEEAAKINSIEIEGVRKEAEKQLFYLFITARTLDPEVYPKLEAGLVSFFDNNEFAKLRVEQKKFFDRQIIKKLEDEIESLENFKTKIYQGNFFESTKGNVMFDPTDVNFKIVVLTKEKLSYQNELALASSVQVVQGFTKFNRPVKPNKAISLATGSSVGLVLVGILIAFKWIRKIARVAEEKQKK